MVDFERPHTKTQTLFIGGVEVTATAAELNAMDGATATAAEINKAADISSNTLELTVSGAVPVTVQNVELNHIDTLIAATIADFANHQGFFTMKDTSATGAIEHTLTLTAGTFDGTNNIATFNLLGDFAIIHVDSAGNGTIVQNTGTIVFSS